MDYGKTLPFTGLGIPVFGVVLGETWLAAIAVGLVLIGAIAVRLTWRRDKDVSSR
ncbi:hypothetical protein [Actinomadura sp. NPDC048394]|jgi:hypothetical protein|uniref:hypothetical protein n=1 Tax=Actinomadura sp. NPDC048394 TaxID=3158223 RepID=UPI0033D32843